jgi:hypothetical protein
VTFSSPGVARGTMAVQIYVPGVVQLVESVGLFLLVSGKLCSILGLGLMPYPGMVDVRPLPLRN